MTDSWWLSDKDCPKCDGIMSTNGDIRVCPHCDEKEEL